MSTAALIQPTLPLPAPADIYRITVDQYDRMVESGALGEDDPIELLNGILVRKMPKNPQHSTASDLCRRAIERVMPPGWHVRKEDPVRIPDYDEPEPDLAMARGDVGDFSSRHPTPGDLALIVEVAESSLVRDRTEKRDIYARAGIPLYWIINLVDRRLEVYSNPSGGDYFPPTILGETDSADLVVGGQAIGRIAVADLLPDDRNGTFRAGSAPP
jgi:Uma2 family endonuclease